MPELEATGERYISSMADPDISYEHWHRYLYATALVGNKTVLDIACGEGYGAQLLSQQAKKVIGVDIHPETVAYAKQHYAGPQLDFQVGSVDAIPVPGKKVFDVIVSFETIEHVDAEKQVAFLTEVKRLLKPGGLFVVSTPNKQTYTDEPHFNNEFHFKEFYPDEFSQFLKGYFKNVALLGHALYPISCIWNLRRTGKGWKEYRLKYTSEGFRPTLDQKQDKYVIALCSQRGLKPAVNSILLDVTDKMRQDRDEMLAVLQKQAEHLKIVGEALRQKEAQIAELGAKLHKG